MIELEAYRCRAFGIIPSISYVKGGTLPGCLVIHWLGWCVKLRRKQ